MNYKRNVFFRLLRIPFELLSTLLIGTVDLSLLGKFTFAIALVTFAPLTFTTPFTTTYLKSKNFKTFSWYLQVPLIFLTAVFFICLITGILAYNISDISGLYGSSIYNVSYACLYAFLFAVCLVSEAINKKHIHSSLVYLSESTLYPTLFFASLLIIISFGINLTLSTLLQASSLCILVRLLIINALNFKFYKFFLSDFSKVSQLNILSLKQLLYEYFGILKNNGLSIVQQQISIILPGLFLPPTSLGLLRIINQITRASLIGLDQSRSSTQVYLSKTSSLKEVDLMFLLRREGKKSFKICIFLLSSVAILFCTTFVINYIDSKLIINALLELPIHEKLFQSISFNSSKDLSLAFVIQCLGTLVNAYFGPIGVVSLFLHKEKQTSKIIMQTIFLYLLLCIPCTKYMGILGATIASSTSIVYQNLKIRQILIQTPSLV